MKIILIFVAVVFAIGVIVTYKWFFIAAAILAVTGYIGYRVYAGEKANNTTTLPGPASTTPSISEGTSIPAVAAKEATPPTESEIHLLYKQKLARFDGEIAAIPKVDIKTSKAVPCRRVRDLPEYDFSNITRKTKLASLFPLVCIDVETTGLHPTKAEIIEVSAIRFERGMEPVSCFTTLCKPKKPIPAEATRINNITDDMVVGAPEFAEIAPDLTEYIRGCNLVGHNLDFDLRFLFVHGVALPIGKRFFDTLDLAHYTISKTSIDNYKLDTLCSYYGILRSTSHRSMADCYATARLIEKLVKDKTGRDLAIEED